jgi:chromosome segregation ATPase
MGLISDASLAAFIAGCFTLASIGLTYYFRNRRSIRKVSAEEYIETFMQREIDKKVAIITAMEETLKNYEKKIKQLEIQDYRKETIIRDLRSLTKELRAELAAVKRQANRWRNQLDKFHRERKI